MPSFKHLVEELEDIGIDLSKLRLPGEVFDAFVDYAESEDDDDDED